jgi:hypothetical protein
MRCLCPHGGARCYLGSLLTRQPARMSGYVDQVLAVQCGLISVAQGAAGGISQKAMAHRVAVGRWQRVHPGVYATSTGNSTRSSASGPAPSMPAPEPSSAIAAHGGWWTSGCPSPSVVHITVPSNRSVVNREGLVVSRTRRLNALDIHPACRPVRFRIERAVLDCAAEALDDGQAAATLATAVQRHSTHPDRLLEVLARLPNLRRRGYLRDVLELTGEGVHSLLEVAHGQACSAHGLPTPARQRTIGPACVDAAYDLPLGTLLAEFGWTGTFTCPRGCPGPG